MWKNVDGPRLTLYLIGTISTKISYIRMFLDVGCYEKKKSPSESWQNLKSDSPFKVV